MKSPFRHNKKVRRHPSTKQLVVSVLVCISILVAAILFWYKTNLQPVDSTNDETVIVTVEVGMNEAQIAAILESREIIRSAFAYELYARLHGKVGDMIAGGYKLTKSQSVAEIIDTFTSGNIAVDLFTILPTQRLEQIKESFREAGYSEEEITSAFNASQYASPALAGKPPLADLEGYLYPESFQFTTSTAASTIIEASLEQMSIALSPSILAGFEEQGLTPHEGVILASIVEREVSSTEDRQKAAQVFLRRYREGISLGSDPTALYGALQFGLEPSVSADTPYNTRLYVGLPPGPINNVSVDSLRSVAYPANTNFLFFVSGDDGKTYFSNTLQEHEALTAQHCIELCKSY
jgi:UPF0755 protein